MQMMYARHTCYTHTNLWARITLYVDAVEVGIIFTCVVLVLLVMLMAAAGRCFIRKKATIKKQDFDRAKADPDTKVKILQPYWTSVGVIQ